MLLVAAGAGGRRANAEASPLECPENSIASGRFLVVVTSLESGDRCRFAASSLPAAGEALGRVVSAPQASPMFSILRAPAVRSGVPFAFMAAVMMAESGGDPFAVGDNGSSVGLFQLHEAGLGASVLQLRNDPSVSAGIAARALADGWREGLNRGLAGNELARFAYGYIYNPGGEYGPQGDKVAAYFRYYSGRPRALGDPPLPADGVLEDAAEVNVGGIDYFIAVFRRGGTVSDGGSLENVLVTTSAATSPKAQSATSADGDWLLVVAVATPTLVAIVLWALRHRQLTLPPDEPEAGGSAV